MSLPLYNATQMIVRTGYFLARIRIEVKGPRIGSAQYRLHLHGKPRLEPRSAGADSEYSRTHIRFLKRSLMHVPVLGWGFRSRANSFPSTATAARKAHRKASPPRAEVLAKGVHITTFVEGTRSKDGRMLPFKKGPFYLAKETGAPCIPVSIWGTETMMSKGSRPHSSRHCARYVSCAHLSGRLCNTRRSDGCRSRCDRVRIAGVDANVDSEAITDDGVVAVVQQLLPHGICIIAIRKRTGLHVDEVVSLLRDAQ